MIFFLPRKIYFPRERNRFSSPAAPKCFFLWLQSPSNRDGLSRVTTGQGFPGIPDKYCGNGKTAVPLHRLPAHGHTSNGSLKCLHRTNCERTPVVTENKGKPGGSALRGDSRKGKPPCHALLSGEGAYYTTEAPGIAPRGFLKKKTAATYSPTGVQYHRRGRA